MSKREELDFTTEQTDRIDEVENACFDTCRFACKRKTNLIGFIGECVTLAQVMTEIYDENFAVELDTKGIISAIAGLVISKMDEYISRGKEPLASNGTINLSWNMEYIGEIADDVALLLVEAGYKVRYPYMTFDENGNEEIHDYI